MGTPPSPGTPSQAHCGITSGGSCFSTPGFFSFLIWVMHNQNKHTEEKPTQPEGLFLSWCVQLTCGVAGVVLGWLRPLFRAGALWERGVRSFWDRSFCQGVGLQFGLGLLRDLQPGGCPRALLGPLRPQPEQPGLMC